MACAAIEYERSELQEQCAGLTRQEVDEEIIDILGSQDTFFKTNVSDSDDKLELNWEYNNEFIETSQAVVGKYLLYATDPNFRSWDVFSTKSVSMKSFSIYSLTTSPGPLRCTIGLESNKKNPYGVFQ
jgi:hypothetical protein